jgi:tetratricopeptide (TPR) repeat protein
MKVSFVPLLVAVVSLPGEARAQLFRPPSDDQRKVAEGYEPAPLALPALERRGPVVALRLRFYADEEYRAAGGARWQDRVRAQIGNVNRVLEPALGVRLEADGFKRWTRKGAGMKLGEALAELRQIDPGLDVDWVVGLVTPAPLLTVSMHELGMAERLGRHFVLRGMSDLEESRMFDKAFDLMEKAERDGLYARRKAHKEVAVFLHEWGHTLGALHTDDPTNIMCASYSRKVSTLAPIDVMLLGTALAARIDARGKETLDWSGLMRFLAENTSPHWRKSDRDELLASLRAGPVWAIGPGAKASGAAAPIPADGGAFERARESLKAAEGHARGNDVSRALSALRAGEEQAERVANAGDRGRLVLWAAQLHAHLGAVTWAEAALERAGPGAEADKLRPSIERLRRAVGLPRARARFSLPPEREAGLVALFWELTALVNGQKREARDRIAAAQREYPNAPGLAMLSCELDVRAGRARAAQKACAAALAGMEDFPRAHYLLAHTRLATGAVAAAVAPLRRAIELDPGERSAWLTLADVYRKLGRRDELKALLLAQERAEAAATAAPADKAEAGAQP